MSEGVLKISICKIILNDALVKLLQHLSWANGLTRAGASTRFTSTSTSMSTCNMCEYEYEYLIIT